MIGERKFGGRVDRPGDQGGRSQLDELDVRWGGQGRIALTWVHGSDFPCEHGMAKMPLSRRPVERIIGAPTGLQPRPVHLREADTGVGVKHAALLSWRHATCHVVIDLRAGTGPALVGIASRPEAAAKLWLFIIALGHGRQEADRIVSVIGRGDHPWSSLPAWTS
jgi:hypothetical protein